jgi:hypothetical protein
MKIRPGPRQVSINRKSRLMALADTLSMKSQEKSQVATIDKLNTTRFFGRADLVADRMLFGWAAPEDNHNWNDGPEVGYVLKLTPPPSKTCRIRVEGVAFIEEKIPAQEITLYVNGVRLGWWRITTTKQVVLDAEIEPEQWITRGDVAIGNVRWHIPRSTSPREIGKGADERQLGFSFMSITVSSL